LNDVTVKGKRAEGGVGCNRDLGDERGERVGEEERRDNKNEAKVKCSYRQKKANHSFPFFFCLFFSSSFHPQCDLTGKNQLH
jgi:hypothetical protein